MNYEKDIVSDELVEVDIGGRLFKLKDFTGPELDVLVGKFWKIDAETQVATPDLVVKNRELLRCVVDAPYEKDGKKFSELSVDERLDLLNSLRNSVRSKLLKAIDDRLNLDEELKKK